MTIVAAEQGLRIMGAPMALWLVQQFLDDKQFRDTMPLPPLQLGRYDWLIFPPRMWLAWPPGQPARLTNIPPVRVDPRHGLRFPAAKPGRPRKRDPNGRDVLFFDAAMPIVQAMVNDGRHLNVVLRGIADELEPDPRKRAKCTAAEVQLHQQKRAAVEDQLCRAWWRHRKLQQADASQSVAKIETFLHEFSRT
jgi:hypothetical protein